LTNLKPVLEYPKSGYTFWSGRVLYLICHNVSMAKEIEVFWECASIFLLLINKNGETNV